MRGGQLLLPVAGVLIAILGFLVWRFLQKEKATGRFAPPEQPFAGNLRPEVAAAVLHGSVGVPSVVALLARLTSEGVIDSRVERGELHLTRGAKPADAYAAAFLGKLFVAGDTTSTTLVRSHYRTTGFNPAALIAPAIEEAMRAMPQWAPPRSRVPWRLDFALLLAGIAALTFTMRGAEDAWTTGMLTFLAGALSATIGFAVAPTAARAVTHVRQWLAALLLSLVPVVVTVVLCADGTLVSEAQPPVLAAAILFTAALAKFMLDVMRSPESKAWIALRRGIAAAGVFSGPSAAWTAAAEALAQPLIDPITLAVVTTGAASGA
jgi:hypothetical protein